MGNLCSKSSESPSKAPDSAPGSASLPVTKKSDVRVKADMFVQENNQKFKQVYQLFDKPLGSGAYGEVWLCTHLSTSEVRAVKILLKDSMSEEEVQKRVVFEEVEILKRLDHPNILKVFEYFESKKKYFIVMEFCRNGDLFGRIEKHGCLNERLAAIVMKQMLSALAYLHGRGYIHRDIKSENLLLSDSENENDINVKLIDFNIATAKKAKLEAQGTLDYMAPEVFEGNYDEKCDVWGAGVILFSVITGGLPFGGDDDESIEKSIKSDKVPFDHPNFSSVSKGCKNFISKLLEKNPKSRPSALQALDNDWLKTNAVSDLNKGQIKKTLTNIMTSSKTSKLKQVFTTFIVTQLSKNSHMRQLERAFSLIDKNSDGVISEKELTEALANEFGKEKAAEEVKKIMEVVNIDEAGNINYTEFVRLSSDEEILLSSENIRKAFSFFDKDGSGSIEKAEMINWLSCGGIIPEDIIKELIDEADKDNDGTIDIQEFEEILLQKLELE
jgi:calcium-dependent protein kinase